MRWRLAMLAWMWTAAFALAQEGPLCEIIASLPKPAGVQQTGFNEQEGQCEINYQFGQMPDEVLAFYAKALPEEGWRIVEQNRGSMGFAGGGTIKAIKDGVHLTVNAGQMFMVRMLTLAARKALPEEVARAQQAPADIQALKKALSAVPVPPGAGKMGESTGSGYVEITYQYAGDLKQAMDWIAQALRDQGWKIKKKQMQNIGGMLGGEVEAEKGKFMLHIGFAHALLVKTISYRLAFKR